MRVDINCMHAVGITDFRKSGRKNDKEVAR
jgi:hypothetical protein